MKNISTALTNFLVNNTVFGRADLATITFPNGTTLNVLWGTNTNITYSGTTYYISQYGAWQRGAYSNSAESRLSTQSFELTAYVPESVNYPGTTTPLMQVINTGMLNGATVSIQTLFWPLPGLPSGGFSMGTMMLTQGQIGNVKPAGRSKIVCEVFDYIYLLNRRCPPHFIQSACRHNLFDAGCTLNVANFTSSNVPLGSSSTTLYLYLNIPARANSHSYVAGNVIVVSNVIYFCSVGGTSAGSSPTFNTGRGATTTDGGVTWVSMNGAYPLGYVNFTSGQNAGLKGSVKLQSVVSGTQVFQLLKPLSFAVTVGDNVQLVPGCDKTIATCGGVYDNLIHFGGMPFVPNPEIAQ